MIDHDINVGENLGGEFGDGCLFLHVEADI